MTRTTLITIVFAASALFSFESANSEPSVTATSGVFISGTSIEISGNQFGSKSTASPLVWDNFESGVLGQLIAGKSPVVENLPGSWQWDDYTAASERPRYGAGKNRPNSLVASKHHFAGNAYNNSLEINYARQNAGDQTYFTFYYYYDKLSSNWSRNHKPWIVYGSEGYYPAAYDGWGNPASGDGSFRNSVQDAGSTGGTLWGGPGISSIAGEWVRIEGFLTTSGPGQNNGAWKMWVHRPNASSPSIALVQNADNYRTRSGNNYWRQWHFGSYHDNIPTNAVADVYIDDIYFDNTQARVEICDKPTWNACTHREIQIPESWSNSTISITFNGGSFAANTSAYLYVVDANGGVNQSGFPITVGSGVTLKRPNPPGNMVAP